MGRGPLPIPDRLDLQAGGSAGWFWEKTSLSAPRRCCIKHEWTHPHEQRLILQQLLTIYGPNPDPSNQSILKGFQTKPRSAPRALKQSHGLTPSRRLFYFHGIQGLPYLPTVKAILFERCLITAEPHRVDAGRGM